ncbi:hypothetical protein Rrhod_0773 [Rhodococcus rhodnii LMG 5362]|uniref:Peroxidase n=1 Tax=Rhodococcus rhodnii LMG 5362 TaxID=1273125 RepID=R7WRH4_9NOCA|nr:hypothetical protein Rrhod_0773 [Rhodococcus rhodnii LMG 5362]
MGAVGAAGLGATVATATGPADGENGTEIEPFHGVHQSGIATRAQAHATFVGLDLAADVDRQRFAGILRVWTEDAARLTSGTPSLTDSEPELAHRPARLTVTVGFGPALFDRIDRVDRRPPWIAPLPSYAIDRLDDAWGQTDVLLQVCSDDPITLSHAVRELVKNVRTQVSIRWVQNGFLRARGTEPESATPRNLFGQKDGTENPRTTEDLDRLVWDDGHRYPWLAGGTSIVLRRIAMNLDTWDELDRPARESTTGRTLDTGAPLTGTAEFDRPDLDATDRYGIPVMPPGSHVARAHFRHEGERFLRRAYNYDVAPPPGQVSDAGLLFAAYQRDIHEQYLPVQNRLAEFDALNQWTTPIGSAVYAIPPGVVDSGDHLGRSLLE